MSGNQFLDEAIALAFDNIEQGGRPFGAVVVKDGKVVARAVNRMDRDNDPTAHAEMLGLRSAGQALGTARLDGQKSMPAASPVRCASRPCAWRVSKPFSSAIRMSRPHSLACPRPVSPLNWQSHSISRKDLSWRIARQPKLTVRICTKPGKPRIGNSTA